MSIADKIRRGDPIPLPIAMGLSALTPITRIAMWNRKRKPAVRVDARVVSYGNLTAGGSGKTPAVIERVRREMAAGRRVAVLTRGYSAAVRDPALVDTYAVTDSLAARLGDEPALIARKAPGVVIAKDPDRVAAAHRAIDEFGCDTLILDDGFQYVRLARDENVAVIDASNPWGNGHLLPRGILREPLSALDRASHFLITRCDQAAGLDGLLGLLSARCPDTPIRCTCHAPAGLVNAAGDRHPPEWLQGRAITAACGIGHPEAFFRTLESLGASLDRRIVARDHGPIEMPADDMVVVTEKDFVRIENPPPHVWALAIDLVDWIP